MNLLIPYIWSAISCQLVDLIQELSYHLQCFVFINSKFFRVSSLLKLKELLWWRVQKLPLHPVEQWYGWWVPLEASLALCWLLTSKMVSLVPCWNLGGNLVSFWGCLDFCMDSPKSTSIFAVQGDGSYPSRPVAEHCRQNAGRRARWGAGNMFCQLLCTWSKAEAARFDRWRAIVGSHLQFLNVWFRVNDRCGRNCFVCGTLHFSIRSPRFSDRFRSSWSLSDKVNYYEEKRYVNLHFSTSTTTKKTLFLGWLVKHQVCTLCIGLGLLIGTRLGLPSYLRAVPLIVLKGRTRDKASEMWRA